MDKSGTNANRQRDAAHTGTQKQTISEVEPRTGMECTLKDFESIPSHDDSSRYELENGVLISREMADIDHRIIVFNLSIIIKCNATAEKKPITVMPSPKLQIRGRISVRIPDLLVADSEKVKRNVSFVKAARGIFEVTNSNSRTDLIKKAEDYALTGVEKYTIVDRDTPRRGMRSHRPRVFVGTLNEVRKPYDMDDIGPDEEFDCPLVGRIIAGELLSAERIEKLAERRLQDFRQQDVRSRKPNGSGMNVGTRTPKRGLHALRTISTALRLIK